MDELFDKLGATTYSSSKAENHHSLLSAEKELGIKFPKLLSKLFEKYNDAISFENGAIFKPRQLSGLEGKDGFLSLDFIYGLGANENLGLIENNSSLSKHDFFPDSLITIGDAGGGNQICFDKKTSKIVFWKHDVGSDPSNSVSEIARNFTNFLNLLKPDTIDGNEKTLQELGVIVDKVVLGF